MSTLRNSKGQFVKGHTKPVEMVESAARKNKGRVPWNKGLPWDDEMKKRISVTNKARGIEPKVKYCARGEYNWRWGGGTARNDRHTEMGRIEYITWKVGVFDRDNRTCQKTGSTGNAINAHHIFNYKLHPKTRFDEWNGITLSKDAHKEYHRVYGVKSNDLYQLEEFLGHELPREQRLHLVGYEVANAIDFNFCGLN